MFKVMAAGSLFNLLIEFGEGGGGDGNGGIPFLLYDLHVKATAMGTFNGTDC
jgi:hypothetical protein